MAQYSKRTSTGNYTIYLLVEDVDTDITNNRSKIQYKAYIVGNSGTSAWGDGTWSANIGGTSLSGTQTYNFRSTKTYYYAGSSSSYVKTGYITHDPDGTKTVTVSLSISGPSLVGSATISTTFTLNTIPRTSSLILSSTSFNISDVTTGLAYRIDSAARFYHKLSWTLNGTTREEHDKWLINGTGTTDYIIPRYMLARMPADRLKTMTVTAITYQDQAETIEIGRVSKDVTVTIDTDEIKPSGTISGITDYQSSISGYLIAGDSKARFTYSENTTISGISTGSPITSQTVQLLNKDTDSVIESNTSTIEYVSGNGTFTLSNVLPASSTNYNIAGKQTITDKRGGNVQYESASSLVYGYTKPNAELNAFRTLTESGTESTIEDGTGTYVYITFSGSVSSSINDQNTVQSIACSISIDGGTAQTVSESGAHFSLRDSESAIITLRVTDKVDYTEVTVAVPPAKYPLDLYDSGDGSVGAGIGGAAKANSFHVYLDQHGYSGKKIVYHTSTGDSIEHDLAGLLFDESGGTGGGDSGGGTGTNNYNELNNKPSINGATLQGNVTLATIGAQPAGNYATESYVQNYHDSSKQNVLTAGDNIVINNDTISAIVGSNANGINYLTGTGTAAKTSTPYCFSKWDFTSESITDYYDGLVLVIKVPIAGNGSYGTCIQINSLGYHPVIRDVNTMISTRYAVNANLMVVYVSGASGTVYGTTEGESSASSSTINGAWVVINDHDADTTIARGLTDYYFRAYAGQAIYRYKLLLQGADNRMYPIVTTDQTSATQVAKVPTTVGLRPWKVWYYSTTTTISAGGAIGAQTMQPAGYGTTAVYNFNTSTGTYMMIYLCGDYNKDTDMFTLWNDGSSPCTSYYKFIPAKTANITLGDYFTTGKYYLLVGGTYSTTNYMTVFDHNPFYYFDGTNLIPASTKIAIDSSSGGGTGNLVDTTANWNRVASTYIPPNGVWVIYSDYSTKTENGVTVNVAGAKIGTGNAYLADLPFVTVTPQEKEFWNQKVSIQGLGDGTSYDTETLIFTIN